MSNNIHILHFDKISSLDSLLIKKIKILCIRSIREKFQYATDNDSIWIAFWDEVGIINNNVASEILKHDLPIIGICMMTCSSPNKHFDNENEIKIPNRLFKNK